MNRYLLEFLIMLQGLVLGCIFSKLYSKFPSDPIDLLNVEYGIAIIIFLALIYLALRLEWGAKTLYQRRAATIIESKRRLQRCHRALQYLTRSQVLHKERPEQGLSELCETAAKTLDVESVSLWLYEREKESFQRVVSYTQAAGLDQTPVTCPAKPLTLYLHDLCNNRVVAIERASSDQRSRNFHSVQSEGATSILDAPLYLDGELAGVLCHNHTGTSRAWTIEEENFAASLADLATLVLEKERRIRSENELQRRSLAIETALDGMAILDKNEHYIYLNDAHARIYGYASADELIGKHWSMLYTESEKSRFESDVMPELLKKGRVCIEAHGKKKDGTLFPQEISLTLIPGDGLICTVRDISARKRVERKLIDSKHFLRTVIDANPHLIFVKDREGRFTLVNQAVADIYGTTVEKLVGKRDSDFNSKEEELDKFLSDDLKVIDNGIELYIPEEIVTDSLGNEHIFQTTKRPLRDSVTGQIQVLGVGTEITQMKQLYQQLVQSQKMEAIGQLAGGIAHDFNNLLTGIIGYADLLHSSSQDPLEVEKAADMIGGAAKRAAQLTEKLLGFARKGKNQNVPVNLNRSVSESLRLFERTLEKDIMLIEQLGAQNPIVRGDPVQIEQVILNLVINARDALTSSNNNGAIESRISINTRRVSLDETFQCEGLASGEYLELTVSDNGCGIPDEIRDRIFEPFFTTKESGKGTGMGLAMVYGIVKNHGGLIWVESKLGEGTTFHVYLPACTDATAEDVFHESDEVIVGKGSVLIVDDHPIIREVTKEMLEVLGYEVATVEDGQEAVKFYMEFPERCQAIILDMIMPKMGAKECINELQRLSADVKIILSTGYGHNEAVQDLLNRGVVGFIQKPYQLNRLSEIVAAALGHTSSGNSTDKSELLAH